MKRRKPPRSATVRLEPAAKFEITVTHHADELIATVLASIENASAQEAKRPGLEETSQSKPGSEKRESAQSA